MSVPFCLEGAVTAESYSEVDNIAEDIGEETGKDYSDDDEYTATKQKANNKNKMENYKTVLHGLKAENKEVDGKNGTDYVCWWTRFEKSNPSQKIRPPA